MRHRSDGRLSYAAYDLVASTLGVAALPLLPLLLLTQSRRGLGERLGRMPPEARALQRPIWVHAASVGDVLAAEPLVQLLRRHRPGVPIIVSTTTVNGRATARAQLPADATMLVPLDLPWIVGGVVRRLQPRCLILLETEIWPALIRAVACHDIPSLMVSGRISPRSARRYALVAWLTRAVLPQISAFAMQSEADAARIIALGAPADRVQVTGNLKFARGVPAAAADGRTTAPWLTTERPVLIAASTHPGEEQLVLDACAALWPQWPDLLLVLAPRRPERFDEVDRLLLRAGVRRERRSELCARINAATQVLLLDTIGELPNLLPAARAVFVGGTIAPIGGHNVLEPALFGKPVAFGPQTANVTAAADTLLHARAAMCITDAAALAEVWGALLRDPQAAAEMGARGAAAVAARAAVAPRTYDVIERFIK